MKFNRSSRKLRTLFILLLSSLSTFSGNASARELVPYNPSAPVQQPAVQSIVIQTAPAPAAQSNSDVPNYIRAKAAKKLIKQQTNQSTWRFGDTMFECFNVALGGYLQWRNYEDGTLKRTYDRLLGEYVQMTQQEKFEKAKKDYEKKKQKIDDEYNEKNQKYLDALKKEFEKYDRNPFVTIEQDKSPQKTVKDWEILPEHLGKFYSGSWAPGVQVDRLSLKVHEGGGKVAEDEEPDKDRIYEEGINKVDPYTKETIYSGFERVLASRYRYEKIEKKLITARQAAKIKGEEYNEIPEAPAIDYGDLKEPKLEDFPTTIDEDTKSEFQDYLRTLGSAALNVLILGGHIMLVAGRKVVQTADKIIDTQTSAKLLEASK